MRRLVNFHASLRNGFCALFFMEEKLKKLQNYLLGLKKVAVAFSGGVDSSFLLKVASDILGKNAIAINVNSPLVARTERISMQEFCTKYEIPLVQIEFDALSFSQIKENSASRCYFCKRAIFSQIMASAKKNGIENIADGSNSDDENDFRPGMKALAELGVLSPLKECGFSKAEIRELSKKMKLETWQMPSAACLASRIEYGQEITEETLLRIDKAEDFLRKLNFGQCRVRVHGNLARIEVLPEQMQNALSHKKEIHAEIKRLGFSYATLDLSGYRTGSMNEILD